MSLSPKEIKQAISKDLRTRKIPHEKAASLLGMGKQTFSNLLYSPKYFTRQMAVRFHDTFGYSIPFLVSGEGGLLQGKADTKIPPTASSGTDGTPSGVPGPLGSRYIKREDLFSRIKAIETRISDLRKEIDGLMTERNIIEKEIYETSLANSHYGLGDTVDYHGSNFAVSGTYLQGNEVKLLLSCPLPNGKPNPLFAFKSDIVIEKLP